MKNLTGKQAAFRHSSWLSGQEHYSHVILKNQSLPKPLSYTYTDLPETKIVFHCGCNVAIFSRAKNYRIDVLIWHAVFLTNEKLSC